MKKVFLFIALSALSTIASAETLSLSNVVKGDGYVYRVIDGDTYSVNINQRSVYNQLKNASKGKQLSYLNDKYKNFTIRLANINTAESKHYDPSKNTKFGKQTSNYVKGVLQKKKIKFTCWDHGVYGRAICSISLNGKDFGLTLIENGYSKYIDGFGKHPYLNDQYKKANNY